MTVNRLQARTPSAEILGVFVLKGHALKFHKIGKDGSAKCDALYTGTETDVVEGVAYEINPSEVAWLDNVEGLGKGYKKKYVMVCSIHGEEIEAFSYHATKIDDSLLPFSWYKRHVLEGARTAFCP